MGCLGFLNAGWKGCVLLWWSYSTAGLGVCGSRYVWFSVTSPGFCCRELVSTPPLFIWTATELRVTQPRSQLILVMWSEDTHTHTHTFMHKYTPGPAEGAESLKLPQLAEGANEKQLLRRWICFLLSVCDVSRRDMIVIFTDCGIIPILCAIYHIFTFC